MGNKFELIDLSNKTAGKKEIVRVFDSFKNRVNDYCKSNNALLYGRLVINPIDNHLNSAKMLAPNIYLHISDAAYDNANIQDLIKFKK